MSAKLRRLEMQRHWAYAYEPGKKQAVNPLRRFKKAMELSGRQWRKFKKSHTFTMESLDGTL